MLDNATINDPATKAPLMETLAALATLSRALRAHWLAELGIDVGQDMVLNRLGRGETVCVSDLANRLQIRPSTVSKMLDRMVAKGWCERIETPDDKRRTLVRLTSTGEQARARVSRMFVYGEAELVKALGSRGSDAMALHLEDTRQALQRCIDRVR